VSHPARRCVLRESVWCVSVCAVWGGGGGERGGHSDCLPLFFPQHAPPRTLPPSPLCSPVLQPVWLAPLVRVCTTTSAVARPTFNGIIAHLEAAVGVSH
jgi:hypothetical protein